MKTSRTECPICSAVDTELLHKQCFISPDQQNDRHDIIHVCNNCSMIYTETIADEDYFRALYESESKYTNTSGSGGDRKYSTQRNLELAKQIDSLFFNQKHCSILDIGCANGELLNELFKLGYTNLHGVDPSGGSLKKINNAQNFKLFKGFLGDIETEQKYDLIILSHVAEHIYNLRSAIKNIKTLLSNHGKVYIEVPDAGRYDEFYVSSFHYFDAEHINHFTVETLRTLMSVHSLQTILSGNKVIPMTEKINYPACYVLASNEGEVQKNNIRKYISKSQTEPYYTKIDYMFSDEEPIIIFGCGSSTTRMLGNSALSKKNILYFIDNNSMFWGQKLMGKEIKAPESIKKDNSRILITSKLYGQEIKEFLIKKLGRSEDSILLL